MSQSYATRREYMREYQRKWIAKRRADFFSNKECVRCGSTEQLELDHIDPTKKDTHNIWSWSEERRLAEIAKCQVLCHDCHTAKTKIDRSTDIIHGDSGYHRGCRCRICKDGHVAHNRQWRASKQAKVVQNLREGVH